MPGGGGGAAGIGSRLTVPVKLCPAGLNGATSTVYEPLTAGSVTVSGSLLVADSPTRLLPASKTYRSKSAVVKDHWIEILTLFAAATGADSVTVSANWSHASPALQIGVPLACADGLLVKKGPAVYVTGPPPSVRVPLGGVAAKAAPDPGPSAAVTIASKAPAMVAAFMLVPPHCPGGVTKLQSAPAGSVPAAGTNASFTRGSAGAPQTRPPERSLQGADTAYGSRPPRARSMAMSAPEPVTRPWALQERRPAAPARSP